MDPQDQILSVPLPPLVATQGDNSGKKISQSATMTNKDGARVGRTPESRSELRPLVLLLQQTQLSFKTATAPQTSAKMASG